VVEANPAPAGQRRPATFQPFRYRYTIEQLGERFSPELMRRAAADVLALSEVIRRGPWQPLAEALARHQPADWFHDAKLGIFLDWGPWSVPGWAPSEATGITGGSYPDWYEFLMANYYRSYHDATWGHDFRRDDFLPLLTGSLFDADYYADLTVRSGARYLVPFARHHGGWTMWKSRYTRRNAVEMGPGRDIVRELVVASRARNLRFGLYFSISEWEYPALLSRPINGWDATTSHLGVWRNELSFTTWQPHVTNFYSDEMNGLASGKIPVRDYFADYLLPLFKEAVDGFDPDIVWYDGGWNTTLELNRTLEMSAYFYNQAEGRKDVIINDRAGIGPRGVPLGDFATREYDSRSSGDGARKWEICRSISPSFGFNWQDDDSTSLSSDDLIRMFVSTVANNGNLLLVIGPDAAGRLSDVQESRLLALGAWLRVNGEAIYGSRPGGPSKSDATYMTASKDGETVYVHTTEWPGRALVLTGLRPLPGSTISMLGTNLDCPWEHDGLRLTIQIPDSLQHPSARPCASAWVFRVRTV
jgi:alpha-L-fucosidase